MSRNQQKCADSDSDPRVAEILVRQEPDEEEDEHEDENGSHPEDDEEDDEREDDGYSV